MEAKLHQTIQTDFEKFVQFRLKQYLGVDFAVFGEYATSVLNFYVGSKLLSNEDKMEAAYFLTQLFNKGLGNKISAEDMIEIAAALIQDATLDYSILHPIFL